MDRATPAQIRRGIQRHDYVLDRLRSIVADWEFVNEVAATYPSLPLFANLRCGAWYTPSVAHECYFKSTDGHVGVWRFSTTRLNLFVAQAAAARGGAIIVDSTKRGKAFPDALSRTVPIWAAVINHVVLGSPLRCTLPDWIPASERDAIAGLLPRWVAGLPPEVVSAIRAALCGRLTSPLEPDWVCNAISADAPNTSVDAWRCCVLPLLQSRSGGSDASSELESLLEGEDDGGGQGGGALPSLLHRQQRASAAAQSVPLLCVSASRVASTLGDAPSAHAGWRYIQGAGDDVEGWARGLTPALLQAHAPRLLAAASDAEACAVIDDLVARGSGAGESWPSKSAPYCGNHSCLSCGSVTVSASAAAATSIVPSLAGVASPLSRAFCFSATSVVEAFPGTGSGVMMCCTGAIDVSRASQPAKKGTASTCGTAGSLLEGCAAVAADAVDAAACERGRASVAQLRGCHVLVLVADDDSEAAAAAATAAVIPPAGCAGAAGVAATASSSADACEHAETRAAPASGSTFAEALTVVLVPRNRQALRRSVSRRGGGGGGGGRRGRAWQDAVLPAVHAAVLRWLRTPASAAAPAPAPAPAPAAEEGGATGSADQGALQLLPPPLPPCLYPPFVLAAASSGLSGHLALLAAAVALQACDRTLRRRLPKAAAAAEGDSSSSSLSSRCSWQPRVSKADVRACVALAQIPLHVGSVPREWLQQLNLWLLTPPPSPVALEGAPAGGGVLAEEGKDCATGTTASAKPGGGEQQRGAESHFQA